MQFGGSHLAFALVEQLDVAAERDGSDAVLGAIRIFADSRQQRLAESDTEAQYLEAEFFRDPIVAELVHGNQDADRNQESGNNQKHHAGAPALSSIMSTARRRAAASASKTSPRVLTGDVLSRCSTLSMTVAIPTKFKRPSRNAWTATSLAALSTVGAVPPERAAARAKVRLGNRT